MRCGYSILYYIAHTRPLVGQHVLITNTDVTKPKPYMSFGFAASGRSRAGRHIFTGDDLHRIMGRRGESERRDLERILSGAVESATEVADGVRTVSGGILSGRNGLRTSFVAALNTVSDVKPGDMSRNAFDGALEAAQAALERSAAASSIEHMHKAIADMPNYAIRMAARQGAGAALSKARSVHKGAPNSAMDAAIKAAEASVRRKDGRRAVRAAARVARSLADIACGTAYGVVLMGVPVHAATAAVFEVGIRDTPPGQLADRVRETCRDLPESARRHDEMTVAIVVALSTAMAMDAASRKKYRTAVQAAGKTCMDEAADRILGTMSGLTFETVYGVLIACACTISGRNVFDSWYEEALAAAFGMDSPRAGKGVSVKIPPDEIEKLLRAVTPDIHGQISKTMLEGICQDMSVDLAWMQDSGEDENSRRWFDDAMGMDYVGMSTDPAMADIISLYRMAYDAGYEGAAEYLRRQVAPGQKRLA